MKFFLLPVTLFLWLTLSYLLLWVGFAASLIVVNFTWMAMLFSFTILFSLEILTAIIIPISISKFIVNFYGNLKPFNILHTIAGLVGVLFFLDYLTADSVQYIIHQHWSKNQWKVILLSVPMFAMLIGMIYSSILMVVGERKDNKIYYLRDYNSEDFLPVEKAVNPSSPTEKEMEDFIRKARAFQVAKNKIKIQRERASIKNQNNSDLEENNL